MKAAMAPAITTPTKEDEREPAPERAAKQGLVLTTSGVVVLTGKGGELAVMAARSLAQVASGRVL